MMVDFLPFSEVFAREAALFRLAAGAHRLRRGGGRLAGRGARRRRAARLAAAARRRYAEALRDLSVVRVAVNQDYVGPEHPIREGDEVALFPPVTGG